MLSYNPWLTKLIGRGPKGVSPAHHWVWTRDLFVVSRSQKGPFQWAITPGARLVFWVGVITSVDYSYFVHHLNCMQCWIHGTAKAFAHKFPTIIIHVGSNILVTSLQNITSCLSIMSPLECLYKFPTCIACNLWWYSNCLKDRSHKLSVFWLLLPVFF